VASCISTSVGLAMAFANFAQHFPGPDSGCARRHALLDLRGNIPAFVHITDGKVHDVNVIDQLVPEAARSR
jgi:hypothetical protein